MREADPEKSKVLQLLAEEAENGILHSPSLKLLARSGSLNAIQLRLAGSLD
jgi:hypothetical protein